MSEYIFGTTRKKVTKVVARKLDALCKAEGGHGFTGPVSIPGNDTRGWFTGPNLGFPFDRNLAERVKDAVARAGLGNVL